MIDRNDLKCPVCGSFSLKQGRLEKVNGENTTRKQREENNWKADNVHTLENRPPDPTWYGCIMCNTEFDGDGNKYEVRKMWPFSDD